MDLLLVEHVSVRAEAPARPAFERDGPCLMLVAGIAVAHVRELMRLGLAAGIRMEAT